MLSFDTADAIAPAPTDASLDPVLKQLFVDRVHDWAATDLLVQASDGAEPELLALCRTYAAR